MSHDNIEFVLVEPSHPGNVGAAARAIGTMGFKNLVLVKPTKHPHPESRARSSGALDILLDARVCDTLEEAIADSSLVIGTTARQRRISVPIDSIHECTQSIFESSLKQKVSIIFGPETSGLSNNDIDRCNRLVYIPTGEIHSSLNLSMAVQVIAYQLNLAFFGLEEGQETRDLASGKEMELFYEHLEDVLLETGFLNPTNPKQLMRRLKALFNRAQLDDNEVNIMRGILTSYQKPRVK
ncbi:MAG: tRNA (cytosine(32)/uridine(32)-2'-O)-methyltransferase TrmJ [Gammaproteobacteria bacterium]|nr:tRNA (cytosine(32)/uridine(32)-2'-O)-methyltransferase TrmJ [Gammaproteobacteria bacterium]